MTATTEKSPADLIRDGQGLVHSLAGKVQRAIGVRIDLDDLIAYGQVGLAEAAREFDPKQGCQFTTFAYYRVRGAIYDGVSKMSWTSRSRYNRLRYEQSANAVLQAEADHGTADRTVADGAKWLRNTADRLAVVYLATQSDEGSGIRDSTIPDTIETPDTLAAAKEIRQRLSEMVNDLPVDERQLIRTIYFEGHTLQEAADRLGISKSWASRLHAKILDRLGRSLRRIGAGE